MSLTIMKAPTRTEPDTVVKRQDGGAAWLSPENDGSLSCRINDINGNAVVDNAKFPIRKPPMPGVGDECPIAAEQTETGRIVVTFFQPGSGDNDMEMNTVEIRSDAGNDNGISVMAYDQDGIDIGEVYAEAEEMAPELEAALDKPGA